MTFTLNPDTAHYAEQLIDYYEAHGCVVHRSGYGLVVMVPLACKWLQPDGLCEHYDNRPELCRQYDGRADPYLRDRCKLPRRLA
jgi:Fe-S-cluster containining protein